jgi:hypothetical protein
MMSKAVLEQMRGEEFRRLVQMSLTYWKGRVSSYEKWREYKSAAVARLNEVEAGDDAYFRIVMRRDLHEQSQRLGPDLGRLYQTVVWRSLRRLKQADRPLRDQSEAAMRKSYLARVAWIAELETATASPEAWEEYVNRLAEQSEKDPRLTCLSACIIVCTIAVVAYVVYKCIEKHYCKPSTAPPTPTPTPTPPQSGGGREECEEVEVCEEVLVEEEEEVCEEECHEECEEE